MNKDYLKEKINNYQDVRKNLWTVVILLSGGITGLIYKVVHFSLTPNSFLDILMLIIASLLDYYFLISVSFHNEEIIKLLNILKEVEK